MNSRHSQLPGEAAFARHKEALARGVEPYPANTHRTLAPARVARGVSAEGGQVGSFRVMDVDF